MHAQVVQHKEDLLLGPANERKGLTMAVAILMDKLNGKRQAGACRTA